jgi:hypothetical protein
MCPSLKPSNEHRGNRHARFSQPAGARHGEGGSCPPTAHARRKISASTPARARRRGTSSAGGQAAAKSWCGASAWWRTGHTCRCCRGCREDDVEPVLRPRRHQVVVRPRDVGRLRARGRVDDEDPAAIDSLDRDLVGDRAPFRVRATRRRAARQQHLATPARVHHPHAGEAVVVSALERDLRPVRRPRRPSWCSS